MFKAAIIGTGRIASSLEKDPLRQVGCTHAGAYSINPDTVLAAGADIDGEALAAFGKDWNLSSSRLYSDYREMLKRESVDIASVCAYAPERLEMSLAAIEAGAKGLWLEKAIGCSIEEGECIGKAARDAGVTAVVDYPRRGWAAYRKIKALIGEEIYGKVQSITCHMTHQLIHTGTHAYDILRYWCGEALTVMGSLELGVVETRNIFDQGGHATLEMENGAVAFVSAHRKKYYIFQFDVIFERARILIGNDISTVYLQEESKNYSGFKELFRQDSFDWGSGYERDMLADLVHCVKTRETPLYSLENAIEALRIALAIFESSRRGGKAVEPRSIDPSSRVESV